MAGCAPKGMNMGGGVYAGGMKKGGMKKGGKVSADMVSPRKAEAMGLSMKIGGTKRSNEGRR